MSEFSVSGMYYFRNIGEHSLQARNAERYAGQSEHVPVLAKLCMAKNFCLANSCNLYLGLGQRDQALKN